MISNETKVGVLAAVSITLLILGYNFMKGENIWSSSKTYYAVYQQIDGLFRSNPVVVNGYKVGHVSSVEMDESTLELIVGINVPDNIKIPSNSVLKITNNDLVGSKAIEIMMGHDSTGYASDGDTLESSKDAGIEQALTSVLTPLSEKVNTVLSDLDTALDDVSLASTLSELSATLKAFRTTASKINGMVDDNSAQLAATIVSLKDVAGDLKTLSPEISKVLQNLEKTTADINEMDLKTLAANLKSAVSGLTTVLDGINNGKGSLGKLANDKELYDNLNKAAASLDKLANDIMKYPRRYTGVTERQRKKGDEAKAEGQ